MSQSNDAPERREDRQRTWSQSDRFVPERFVQPVLRFMRTEASGGILMLVAALAALLWANSAFGDSYTSFWDTQLNIEIPGVLHLEHTLQEWVNDALMVIFFFVVGLEIKRELVIGELSDPREAVMPAVAAVGGMVVPALIYLLFAGGTEASHGWGIPMATDIAFAVGVISLVGSRVPIGAKLFLLALAIVDDIGAILVIAVFYTDDLALGWLAVAAVALVAIVAMKRMAVRSMALYVIGGTVVWFAFLESGVHATIAGVILALLTPARPFYLPDDFADAARSLVDKVDEYAGDPHLPEDRHTRDRIQSLLQDVSRLSTETVAPLDRLEHRLEPWSSFLVVPIFAFANAGVRISGDAISGALGNPVLLGVAVGLLAGKVVGVTGATWIAVELGLGRLPRNTTWRHIIGLGLMAAIGFTVALFVTALAFEDPTFTDSAKIGIFIASLIAGVSGFLWLRAIPEPGDDAEEDLREADAGTAPA
ncbi:MAG: Na+/H+ antiporter NhaA [Actinobacteria bacterium]|nr:Na+/H+ antiporter NhaA [Actinomycetota bacterium]